MEGISEGRIVHFVLAENICRAAIIVNSNNKGDFGVTLQVFIDMPKDEQHVYKLLESKLLKPSYTNFKAELALYSELKEIGTWHWPERE